MNNMLKVGVVGLGAMGQHHARLYSALNCKLVGVADSDQEKAREIGKKYDTAYYSDYRSLLTEVDAISIAVPTTAHRQICIEFMKNSVHCLVEKPIASTIEEAKDIVRAAEENRVKLMVGHIERFNPAVQKLKQIIDQGLLGKVMIISTRRVGPFVPRVRDVGIIVDSATHDIDAIRYLMGKEPIKLFSKSGRFKHSKEDHAIIVLDFNDATACIEVNWFTPHKVRTLVATGTEGIAYLDYIDQTITLRNSRDMEEIEITKAEPLQLELQHFLDCIISDSKPLVDGTEGLRALEIALIATSYI